MNAFFASPERQARLLAEAESWVNTPFRAHAAVKGAGADCVKMVAEIMVACGLIPGYTFPPYTLDWAKHQDRSLVLEWLDACPQVARVPVEDPAKIIDLVQIGDVLGFTIGRCVQHAAVALNPPLIINAVEGARVSKSQLNDPTWGKRLTCIYRPVAP